MKKMFLLLPTVVPLLFAQAASADLTRLAENVHSYVGKKDGSPAHSFATNATRP
ncbi:MAG TPA: hypothetical protein VIH45_12065 [Desulfuromonadaceae bacterium]